MSATYRYRYHETCVAQSEPFVVQSDDEAVEKAKVEIRHETEPYNAIRYVTFFVEKCDDGQWKPVKQGSLKVRK